MYLPHFFCAKDDYALLKSLTSDLEKHSGSGMINWCAISFEPYVTDGALERSQHLKHENPTFSPTFQSIVKRLEQYESHFIARLLGANSCAEDILRSMCSRQG